MVLGRVLFISSDTVRYTALSRNLQPYCDGMQVCSGPEVLEAAAVVISDCSFSELTVSACPGIYPYKLRPCHSIVFSLYFIHFISGDDIPGA